MVENLRSEILRFATFFRHAVADGISHHDPTTGIYEAQRFDNWMKLNNTSVLSTFQDKVFLQSTHEAAVHVMRDSSANLSPDEVGMIKRLAVVEDAIPMADEYRRWKPVLTVVQRYALLFNGMPTIVLVLLWAFVVPAAMGMIAMALAAVLPRSGLPHTVVDVVTVTSLVLNLSISLIGFAGPFARASIAVRLNKKVAASERLVTARITSGQATAVLALIRQKLAALDPGFAARHEILPEQMLAPLHAEVAFLQAKIATRHLTACWPTGGASTSTSIIPDGSSSTHSQAS
jgi:hypothetical protein